MILFSFAFFVLNPIRNGNHSHLKYKKLYDFLGTLPKNIMIAGHPLSRLTESLPLFAKRTTFSIDRFLPLFSIINYSVYTDKCAEELETTKALYTTSADTLINFITKNKIDFFIVETSFYDPRYITGLKKSSYLKQRSIYNTIPVSSGQDTFFLLNFAKSFPDFKLKLANSMIYVVDSNKIKNFYKEGL